MRPLHAVAIAVSALAIFPTAASATSCAGADLVPQAANLATVEQATLCLLNEQRAAAGLAPVTRNTSLDVASRAHSEDMVARKYFAHDTPEGVGFLARVTKVGYVNDSLFSWNAGENIAWGAGTLAPPAAIMTAWMNSQHHRDNILDRDFKEVGVGVVVGVPIASAGSVAATYTTDFGARVANPTSTSSNTAAASSTTTKASKAAAAKKAAKAKKAKKLKRCLRSAKRHHQKTARCYARHAKKSRARA
jgi:uncharacterized protein YkwD